MPYEAKNTNMEPITGKFLDPADEQRNIVEEITGGIKNISSDHALNHIGRGFKANIEVSNLAQGQSLLWSFVGPEINFVHIKDIVFKALGASAKLEIFQDVTLLTNTGTIVPSANTNHNSDIVAGSAIKESPTYSGGSLWDKMVVLIDSTNQFVGQDSMAGSINEELITKNENEPYILKLTNIGSSALTKAYIKLFFYEERKGLV